MSTSATVAHKTSQAKMDPVDLNLEYHNATEVHRMIQGVLRQMRRTVPALDTVVQAYRMLASQGETDSAVMLESILYIQNDARARLAGLEDRLAASQAHIERLQALYVEQGAVPPVVSMRAASASQEARDRLSLKQQTREEIERALAQGQVVEYTMGPDERTSTFTALIRAICRELGIKPIFENKAYRMRQAHNGQMVREAQVFTVSFVRPRQTLAQQEKEDAAAAS